MIVVAWVTVTGPFSGSGYAASFYGLGLVLLALGAAHRQWPRFDLRLGAIALLFLALCWLSISWSIEPQRTLRGAGQLTLIFAGALILLSQRWTLDDGAERIRTTALAGMSVGGALGAFDFLVDHPIMRHFVPPNGVYHAVGAKMDRGLAYAAILSWPILALNWRPGRKKWCVLMLVLVGAMIALSNASTVQLGAAVGLAALGVASVAPGLVAGGLAALSVIAALLTPVLALDFGATLMPLATAIKTSAVHRLEIWDYMSRRAFERPISGWGWWTAEYLPIRPDELARYRYVTAAGTPHPHGNWVQLWVETGIGGVALGLAFALLVLWRAWKMPKASRPFALACCTAVFIDAVASFDLASDSWWAVQAAAALLFSLLPKAASMDAPT